MKMILTCLLLISSELTHADETTSFSCRPSAESQCPAGDEKCFIWGNVQIADILVGKSLTATFYSEGDDECENCESVDYTFEKSQEYVSSKKKFYQFTGNTPHLKVVNEKNRILSKIFLTTDDEYIHVYSCTEE